MDVSGLGDGRKPAAGGAGLAVVAGGAVVDGLDGGPVAGGGADEAVGIDESEGDEPGFDEPGPAGAALVGEPVGTSSGADAPGGTAVGAGAVEAGGAALAGGAGVVEGAAGGAPGEGGAATEDGPAATEDAAGTVGWRGTGGEVVVGLARSDAEAVPAWRNASAAAAAIDAAATRISSRNVRPRRRMIRCYFPSRYPELTA